MKYDRIPEHSETVPMGLPIYRPADGEDAVLVLHGFTGTTSNMSYLVDRLAEGGFTCYAPRLPGHGTNFTDFHLTGWKDWLRRSIDAYLDLHAAHRNVYVTGLSMGGILTLILASLFDVPKIGLCAPALKVQNRLIPFTPLLRFILPKLPTGYEETSENSQRQHIAREYLSVHTSYSVSQLYRLQRYARRVLPKVKAETLTIISKEDEAVPEEVADLIESRISSSRKKRVVLEHSSHVLTEHEEKERVADEILNWFSDGP